MVNKQLFRIIIVALVILVVGITVSVAQDADYEYEVDWGVSFNCDDGTSFTNGTKVTVVQMRSGFNYTATAIGLNGFDPILGIVDARTNEGLCTDDDPTAARYSADLPTSGLVNPASTNSQITFSNNSSEAFADISLIVGGYNDQGGEFLLVLEGMVLTQADGEGDPFSLEITPSMIESGVAPTAYIISVTNSFDPLVAIYSPDDGYLTDDDGNYFACDDAGNASLCWGESASLNGSYISRTNNRQLGGGTYDAMLTLPLAQGMEGLFFNYMVQNAQVPMGIILSFSILASKLKKPLVIRKHFPLLLVLLAYLGLATHSRLQTPFFEAPDAYYHFAVIEHLARTGEMPPQENPQETPWRQMTFHAPLYYIVSAQLIAGIDTTDFYINYRLNPHAQIGLPDAEDNQNFIAHVDDSWHDTGLAVRIVRLFSIILGGITLVGVYVLANEVLQFVDYTSRQPIALLAALTIVFMPQFIFMSGIISNDNLVTALSTLILAYTVWLLNRALSWRTILLLSILLALNSLAKASGLVLYPVVAVAMLWKSWHSKIPVSKITLYALIGGIGWLGIAGWWYWGNWQNFGDFTATAQIAEVTGKRVGSIVDLRGELRGLYFSFWGLFGWFNVLMPGWFYRWTQVFVFVAVLGGILGIFRSHKNIHKRHIGIVLLFLLYVVIFLLSWWQFHQLVNAAQGRLWFPLLGVFAIGLACGLSQLPRFGIGVLLGGMAIFTLLFPFWIVAPTYTPTEQFPAELWDIPANAVAFEIREPWVEEACLRLWTMPVNWDGQSEIQIHYWWQATCDISGYWSVFVHLVDLEQESCQVGDNKHILAQYDTMPDGGKTPMPALNAGQILADTITISVPENINPNREWHIQTGLYDAGGTFIRAFVTGETLTDELFIGQCAPETIVYSLR